MWNKISVYKYQQIVDALNIEDAIDRCSRLIAIVFDKTIMEVESMGLETYLEHSNKLAFIKDKFNYEQKKYIDCNGKRYLFEYDIRQLPASRYIEIKHFGSDMIGNLHQLFASMVKPMKKKWYGWVIEKYDASKHEEYANDILHANIQDVYNSVVFFYHVYRNWIEVTKDYTKMLAFMENKTMEREVATLIKFLDGNIPPKLLPTITISNLQKRMNYQL